MDKALNDQILKYIEKYGGVPLHGGGYFQPPVITEDMIKHLEKFTHRTVPESVKLARHHRVIIDRFARDFAPDESRPSGAAKPGILGKSVEAPPGSALKKSHRARAKVEAYRRFLKKCPEFQPEWERLLHFARPWCEALLLDCAYRTVPETHTSPDDEFDLICDRWYLEGVRVSDNEPLVLEPKITTTATGTQLHIPGYFSADFSRDIDLAVFRAAHHKHGARRQGEKLLENRSALRRQALLALEAHQKARKNGMRGDARLDFMKVEIGLCDYTDPARIRKLVRMGRALIAADEKVKPKPEQH